MEESKMEENNAAKPKQHKRNTKRFVIVMLSSFLSLIVVSAITAYSITSSILTTAVPIVTASPEAKISPTPIPTPNLPEITGEPEDIGEDYDDPITTGVNTVMPSAEPTAEPIYKKISISENVINILIIGQDLRPEQTGRGRSDTMMILSYNRKDRKASIVSLMRDTWVPIEGHDWNRLNTAFRFGGPGLAINTINTLFNLDIQNYIIVNFDGMSELIDKIGGVDVNVTKVEAAYYNRIYGWRLSAGKLHLNGEQSLAHARNRKSNGGDFERIRRQQDIMLAVYQKMSDIRDPVKLAELAGFMMHNVKTNLTADMLFTMGLEIVEKGNIEIRKGRMPADKTWRYANKDGRSVITIDFGKNIEYLHELIYDDK
jgi:polyisoprenyl-teichoic acid--peptidoglycan teichoic acid transferase